MGIEPAGIGKHPNDRPFQKFVLATDFDLGCFKRVLVSADAENSDRRRMITGTCRTRRSPPARISVGRTRWPARGAAIDEVGDAVPQLDQPRFFKWRK